MTRLFNMYDVTSRELVHLILGPLVQVNLLLKQMHDYVLTRVGFMDNLTKRMLAKQCYDHYMCLKQIIFSKLCFNKT